MTQLLSPNSSRALALVLTLLHYGPLSSSAYDIGCLYPEDMPDPFVARYEMVEAASVFATFQRFETPIAVRIAHASSYCNMNCLAAHDPSALNTFTMTRPELVAPSYGHNAFSIVMCIAECYNVVFGEGNSLGPLFEKWGLPVTGLEPEVVVAATTNPADLVGIVVGRDFHPLLMGQLVGLQIGSVLQNDGWNSNGQLTYDAVSETAVPCTSNCQPYKDISGYFPRNHPGPEPGLSGKKNGKKTGKYVVAGDNKHWQPLLEDDGNGYFSRQEHVTPHIGLTVKPILQADDTKHAPDPKYDYREESLKVVEELRQTASSQTRKSKIEFFDNKLWVRGAIQLAARDKLASVHSFQSHLGFIHGLSSAEYDATLMAWREKVRHDLVRPTTVIQRWGDDELDTYNGDRQSSESKTIKARDFQAYVRVMPHSEYPSGSACLCTGYAEFTDIYVETIYPDFSPMQDIIIGSSGFQINCNGEFPYAPNVQVGCTEMDEYTFGNVNDMAHQCGASRLWGGMHFSKSVPAAEELCSGLGSQSFDYITTLENNSNWGGNAYFKDDPRPVCGAA